MATYSWATRLSLLMAILYAVNGQNRQAIMQQEVPFGGRVTLNCNSADGAPVFWRTPPRATRQDMSSITVVMDSASKYGDYRCYSQRVGSPPTLGRTVRLIRPASTVNLDEALVIVQLNSPYTIVCPENFGARNTNWLRFDKRRQRWITVRARTTREYKLFRVNPTHLTTWRCEAANGQASGNGRRGAAIVLSQGFYPQPRARLTSTSESGSELIMVKEGQNKFVMECEPVRGTSSNDIAWEFKNPDSSLSAPDNDGYAAIGRDASTQNVQVQAGNAFSSLEINKCNTQNSGFYRCKMPGGGRKYARLRVKKKEPEIHRFGKKGVQQKQANKAESVSFTCKIEKAGMTASDLYWVYRPKGSEFDKTAGVEYRLGDPPTNGVAVTIEGDRSRLTISSAQKANQGRYFCQLGDVSDYTDLIVGAGFDAAITVNPSFNYLALFCSVTRNGVADSPRKYRFMYYEMTNGARTPVRNYRRVPRYMTKDRTFLCEATDRIKQKTARSMPAQVKGVTLTLTSATPTGLRTGAPITLRCESSDKSIRDTLLTLSLNGGRAPYAQRTTIRPGVVNFVYSRVNKRNTGDYECVLARTIKSNVLKVAVCEATERLCRDMSKCYPVNKKCDGVKDCADGSDEERNQCMECEPHSMKCQRFNRRDPDVKCVLKHWICDGQDDCGNGWDEFVGNSYCSKHPLPIKNCGGCGRNETCCSDGKCFPRAYECDKESDCPTDRIDETTCTCSETSQLEIETPVAEMTRPVRKGDTLELRCRVRGKERPTINWRFNWGHLPNEVRFVESMTVEQVVPEGSQGAAEIYTVEGKLLIKNVDINTDLGRYTCEAVTKCKRRLAPDYILVRAPGLIIDCKRMCYNHTTKCDQVRCFNCQHNTYSLRCDGCKLGYCGDATIGGPGVCKACKCNKHSSMCNQRTCVCENCRDNTEGDFCERCKPGYEGNALNGGVCRPKVKLCPCGAGSKTTQAPCGQPCECKRFATGDRCDSCLPGYFGISRSHDDGCLPCYCNNRASLCAASGYYYVKTPKSPPKTGHELLGRGLYSMTYMDASSFKVRRTNNNYVVLSVATREKRDDDESYLVSRIFSGNNLRAYGGNVMYTVQVSSGRGEMVYKKYPIFGLKGRRGKTLWYRSNDVISARQRNSITIPIRETSFTTTDQKPISRDDLMVVLKTLHEVLFRVQYYATQSGTVTFSGFSIDLAQSIQAPRSTANLAPAPYVEKCESCVSPYQDLFCDKCMTGFHRHTVYRRQYERIICIPCETGYSKTISRPQVAKTVVAVARNRVKRRIRSRECNLCEVGYANYNKRSPMVCEKSLKLVVEPEYYRVVQGRQLVLWCSATFSSHPVWLLNWERVDKKPLPDKARVERDGNTIRLVIPDVTEADAQQYRCSANNRWTRLNAYSDVNVITDGSILRVDLIYLRVGGENVIRCNVTNSQGSTGSYRIVLGYSSFTQLDRWQQVRMQDATAKTQQEYRSRSPVNGRWQCHVTDMVDKYTVSKTLLVQKPPGGRPLRRWSLRVNPTKREYQSGQRMVLRGIRVSGGNSYPVAWHFEKKASSARAFSAKSRGLFLPRFAYQSGDDLVVAPMSEEYAGTYFLRRRMPDGTYKDSNPVAKAVITVRDFEIKRKIKVNINSRVSIPCFNSSDNVYNDGLKCDKYVWSKRTVAETGQQWAAARRFTAGGPVQDENYIIPRVMTDSSGIYTCRCYILIASSARVSYSVLSQTEVLVLTELDVKPKVRVRSDQREVKAGMTINLNCTAKAGRPTPSITWSGQFGLVLAELPRARVTSGVGWSNLRIANFDVRRHTGAYKCRGENRLGHTTSHANLYFENMNNKFAPTIGSQYYSDFKTLKPGTRDTLRVQAGAPMEILCRGVGSPIPITRAYFTATTPVGDTPTSPETELTDVQPAGRKKKNRYRDIANVRKADAQPADSGIYRCKTTNSEGSAEKVVKVEVIPSNIETFIEVKWFDSKGQLVPAGQNRRPDVPVEEGKDVLVICRARYLNGTKISRPKFMFKVDQVVHGRHLELPRNAVVGPKTVAEDRSDQLKFKNVIKKMMDITYACYVQDQSNFNNGLGYAQIRLQVKDSVSSPLVQIRRSSSPQPVYDPADPRYASINPELIRVNAGDSLDIGCYYIRGSPSPTLEMKKCQSVDNECTSPGDPIPNVEIYDDRTPRENRRFTRLRIRSMKDEYNGKYQCLGEVPFMNFKTNGGTLSSLRASETVMIFQNRKPASYVADASRLTVQINSQTKMLEVECFVTGVPAPRITMGLPATLLNLASPLPAEIVNVKPSGTEILQRGTRLVLTVSLAQQDRARGQYSCVASNNQGTHRIVTDYLGV